MTLYIPNFLLNLMDQNLPEAHVSGRVPLARRV